MLRGWSTSPTKMSEEAGDKKGLRRLCCGIPVPKEVYRKDEEGLCQVTAERLMILNKKSVDLY